MYTTSSYCSKMKKFSTLNILFFFTGLGLLKNVEIFI